MSSFQLIGISPKPFEPLFSLSDEQLASLGIQRVFARSKPGHPCRVSLVDADIGEELLLLSYEHQPAKSPYQASGPIYVRRGARQQILPIGTIPDYVSLRLMSVRAYDGAHMMIDANVCEGSMVAEEIQWHFSNPEVRYIHLHNAKRGCFSCLVQRAAARAA
jgi:hypothetical protein